MEEQRAHNSLVLGSKPSGPTMTLEEFERRCELEAQRIEESLLRYVSSPQEHELALPMLIEFFLLRGRSTAGRWPLKPDVAGSNPALAANL